ncbi:hypothetical protein ABTM90_19665, partial [Acinetobacter baumannii]
KARLQLPKPILPGFHAGTMLISRARFHQVGWFFEQQQVGEFVDWYFRVLAENIPHIMLNTVLMKRRVHGRNMGRQQDLYSRQDYLKIIK